jgi:hypothetical protein
MKKEKMKASFPILSLAILAHCQEDANPERYGRWCGPVHGGYQDCCNNSYCPSCGPGPARGDYSYRVDPRCLLECPPIDAVDLACAQHDTCCFIFGAACGTLLTDQHCFCNSLLAHASCHFQPYNRVCWVFSPSNFGLGCWACRPTGAAAPTCVNERDVFSYGPNQSVALKMLESLNATGETQFGYYARQAGEMCHV